MEFTVAQDTVAKTQSNMVEIVVPKDTIKAGTPITADVLEEAQVPKRYVPADAADESSKSDLIGKSPVGDLSKGVPISMGTVQGSSNPSSISSPSHRAMWREPFRSTPRQACPRC